ncbi:hypothetical protein R3P38DRAFT_3495928 [Favolaschia claudopus]|uniref:F-box domain-containing protein n=1 Tax=Favolaschia claudopus TaxID=2862362 RepID=A0AAV9Z5C7_9AGAR
MLPEYCQSTNYGEFSGDYSGLQWYPLDSTRKFFPVDSNGIRWFPLQSNENTSGSIADLPAHSGFRQSTLGISRSAVHSSARDMHPCLAIPEILELVVSVGLERTHTVVLRRDLHERWTVDRALAALARTCKYFHEFAQNELWKDQDGILNVIRCMPKDLWDFEYDLWRNRTSLKWNREVRPTDWDRVSKNAARVQSLTIKDSEYPRLTTAYEMLSRGVPGGWFLPNLQLLCWNDYLGDVPYINLFLGPRLTCIEFKKIHDDRCPTALETLAQTHPQLESVTVEGVTTRAEDEDRMRLREFIRQLPHLQNLKVHYIDPDTLHRLGAESGFYGLTTSPLTFRDFVGHADADGTMFPDLRRLYIDSETCIGAQEESEMEHLLHFLRVCNSPPLRVLYSARQAPHCAEQSRGSPRFVLWSKIAKMGSAPEQYFPPAPPLALSAGSQSRRCGNILSKLTDKVVHLQLRKAGDASANAPSQQTTTTAASVYERLLLHCNNLVNLYIGVPAGYDLDDKTIADMASAWPHLETLSFESNSDYEPKCTLMALYHIARNCQQLHWLSLAFNASDVPDIPVSAEGLPQSALKTLVVGGSPIRNRFIGDVADFIDFSFNRLTRILIMVGGSHRKVKNTKHPKRKIWAKVEGELFGLRACEDEV